MSRRNKIAEFVTRPAIIIGFILISFILSLIQNGLGPIFGFVVILFTLWSIRWDWKYFSFQKNPFFQTLLKALYYTVIIVIINDFLFQPIIEYAFGATDLSSLDGLKGNLANYIIFMLFMWIFAAFGEEFFYRGYITKRLAIIIGNSRMAWMIAIIISSGIFGFAHLYQGISGVITTGFVALIFGVIFYKNQKNLWVCVLTHGIYDAFGITLIYLDKYHISEWSLEHIFFFL